MVETLCDIWTLLLDSDEDIASLVVEAFLRRIVPNLLDGLANDLLEIDLSLGSDLAEYLRDS